MLDKQILLKGLEELRDEGPTYVSFGICTNVKSLTSNYDGSPTAIMYDLFKSWPKFSGDKYYPVPSPSGCNASLEYDDSFDLWDKTTEYGRSRWELLDFMISELQTEINA